MAGLVIVRYGELGLKSPPVRREFERTLQRNILAQFLNAGATCRLRADHGHLYVEADDSALACALPRRVFGVTSVSPAVEIAGNLAELAVRAADLAGPRVEGRRTFAVRARRTGNHPYTSQDLGREAGSAILAQHPGLKVDLDHPEFEVFVEVRGPRAYVYFEKLPGPGGLPLGVAGTVVALVDGSRGALGAFLMMKRGCRARIVSTGPGDPLAKDVLARFDPRIEIRSPNDPVPLEGLLEAEAAEGSVDGIVLPLTVDDYPAAREAWGDRVIFSPTVGLTEEEVASRWQTVQSLVG